MNLKKLIAGGVAVTTGLATMVSAGFGLTINDPELDMAIDWMSDNGMTKYDSQETFMPMHDLTREQSTKFMGQWAETNLCLAPISGNDCDFSDIPADPSLEEHVIKSCLLGMVKGKDGMFYPTANVTKAEYLTMIVRAIRAAAGEEPLLDETVSPWWKGYYDEARLLGLTKETDVWALDRSITRYEAALILYRARIDDPTCEEDIDWTDWLDDVLNGDDDEDTDTDDDDVVYYGDLDVTLNPETPKGATVPGLAQVHVASFDVKADQAATLSSITLERLGLGNKQAVTKVTVFVNGVAATRSRAFEDDGTRELNFSPSLNLEDDEMVTIDVIATIGSEAVASNQEFQIAAIQINGEDITPVVAEEFEVGGVDAVSVEIDVDTSPDTVQVGEKDVEVASFSIKNEDDDYDVMIDQITLEDDENDARNNLENFRLEFDGDVIATIESIDGKYLTFKFDTPIVISDGQTEDFEVIADVIAGVDDTIRFVIDEENFIMGTDSNYGYGLAVNFAGGSAGANITIQAGEVTLEEINIDRDELREDADDYVLAAFDLTVNAGNEIELDKINFEVSFNNSIATGLDQLFDDIEIHVGNSSEDAESLVVADGGDLEFDDLFMSIPSATTVRIEVRGDTKNNLNAYLGANFNLIFDGDCNATMCNNIELEDVEEGEDIVDLTPETLTFDDLTIVEPGIDISDLSMADVNVVVGAELVDFAKFQIETDDVSPVEFRSVTLSDLTPNDFNDTLVDNVTLWRETANGWVEVESENDFNGANLEIDGFNVEIPMATTQVFMVTIDVTSNSNLTGDVQAQLNSFEIRDDDNNTIVDATTFNSRVVTIIGEGTLAVSFDASNTRTDEDMYVLGGKLSSEVAAFELTAQDEDVEIEDMLLVVTGANLDDFEDTVSRVHILDSNLNAIYSAPVGTDVSTNGGVTINNLSPNLVVSADESMIIYVALETKPMGKNKTAGKYGTDDFTFSLNVTEADGATSNADITANGVGMSNPVAIKPVLISSVELSDTNDNELTSATQRIGTLRVTADDWSNSKEGSTNTAELELQELNLNYYGNFTGFRLRAGSAYVAGTISGNVVTFDIAGSSLSESDKILVSGETATFYVELDGTKAPSAGESVTIEFDETAGSSLEYAEEDDTCSGSTDSCVDTLRLGESYYGSASASRD